MTKIITLFYLMGCFFSSLYAGQTCEETFTNIYKNRVWGTNHDGGTSGDGSTLEATKIYRNFLQSFLHTFNIKSVVDVGCGDWVISGAMNWDGIHYTGYDVVKFLIEENQAKFGAANIHFVHGDAVNCNLPHADLLICRDVLQHLPNADIQKFLKKLKNFKYCLISNDVNPQTGTSDNPDVVAGGYWYRYLDLTKKPFYVKGTKVFTYVAGPNLKQVLLITRD